MLCVSKQVKNYQRLFKKKFSFLFKSKTYWFCSFFLSEDKSHQTRVISQESLVRCKYNRPTRIKLITHNSLLIDSGVISQEQKQSAYTEHSHHSLFTTLPISQESLVRCKYNRPTRINLTTHYSPLTQVNSHQSGVNTNGLLGSISPLTQVNSHQSGVNTIGLLGSI